MPSSASPIRVKNASSLNVFIADSAPCAASVVPNLAKCCQCISMFLGPPRPNQKQQMLFFSRNDQSVKEPSRCYPREFVPQQICRVAPTMAAGVVGMPAFRAHVVPLPNVQQRCAINQWHPSSCHQSFFPPVRGQVVGAFVAWPWQQRQVVYGCDLLYHV